VATPANEAELVHQARLTTASQLERICRLFRQVRSLAGEDPRSIEDRRWVEQRATEDGMVSIQIRLLPDEAARLMRALEISAGDGSLADGAVALAESALAGGPSDDAPRPPVEVVLHVAAATLEGRTEAGDGIPAETCRRILCDAGIVPVTEDASGQTIDVGRKTRTIPAALRRALHARDHGCCFPGCSNRRVDAHHIHHWIEGGETKLSNMVSLCRRHHRYMHELLSHSRSETTSSCSSIPTVVRSRKSLPGRRGRRALSIDCAPRTGRAGSRFPRRATRRDGTVSRSIMTRVLQRS
jgi:hypothetical protein